MSQQQIPPQTEWPAMMRFKGTPADPIDVLAKYKGIPNASHNGSPAGVTMNGGSRVWAETALNHSYDAASILFVNYVQQKGISSEARTDWAKTYYLEGPLEKFPAPWAQTDYSVTLHPLLREITNLTLGDVPTRHKIEAFLSDSAQMDNALGRLIKTYSVLEPAKDELFEILWSTSPNETMSVWNRPNRPTPQPTYEFTSEPERHLSTLLWMPARNAPGGNYQLPPLRKNEQLAPDGTLAHYRQ